MDTVMSFASLIDGELDRLQVSTNYDPCFGLMVEDSGTGRVKIFDDSASGFYNAEQVYLALKELEETTLQEIWQGLKPFEVW